MNPARSLGPAITAGNFSKIWIYMISPVVGTVIGSSLYNFFKIPKIHENKEMPTMRAANPEEDVDVVGVRADRAVWAVRPCCLGGLTVRTDDAVWQSGVLRPVVVLKGNRAVSCGVRRLQRLAHRIEPPAVCADWLVAVRQLVAACASYCWGAAVECWRTGALLAKLGPCVWRFADLVTRDKSRVLLSAVSAIDRAVCLLVVDIVSWFGVRGIRRVLLADRAMYAWVVDLCVRGGVVSACCVRSVAVK
ncbi:Aquaporin NIP3-1 [Platanthera zijinensis]|uniref:Aquaporin NIP3-1 n=1 Tax=Platanthera zijinensis TaxID=2320716 RepID=A0AAP0BAT6_9ASPA